MDPVAVPMEEEAEEDSQEDQSVQSALPLLVFPMEGREHQKAPA